MGRLGPACSQGLAALDRSSRQRIAKINTLEAVEDASDVYRKGVARNLAREKARALALRRALVPAREAYDRFMAVHASNAALDPADYSTYQRLLTRVNTDIDRLNRAIKRHDATVDVYNKAVRAFNKANQGATTLDRAEGRAADRADAREERCLGRITDWPLAVRRLEQRLPSAAIRTRLSGAAMTDVSCDSPGSWRRQEKREAGYEPFGYVVAGEETMHLSPRTCLALARLVAHPAKLECVSVAPPRIPRCPPSIAAEAVAVVTLTHEEQHIAGIENEARAQCNALQLAVRAARQLGVQNRVARRIAAFVKRTTKQPPEYRSDECRRGGALDLHLAGGWPI